MRKFQGDMWNKMMTWNISLHTLSKDIQGRYFVWEEDKWHGLKMPSHRIGKISRSEIVVMEQGKL